MELTVTRRLLIHSFGTIPRLIIILFTLLTITVSNIISIVLLKLVPVNFTGKIISPELKRLIDREPNTLKEESKLESTEMLKMLLIFQGCVQGFHTRRETLSAVEVEV